MKKFFAKLLFYILYGLSKLPMCVLYAFSRMVYVLAYHILRYRLKVVRANLLKAFPEKDDKERRTIEKKFYKHLCDYIFETLKAISIPLDKLVQRMHFTNPELITNYNKQGRSVFMYAAHMGNWEWYIVCHAHNKGAKMQTFYQPQSSEFVNYLTHYSRSRNNTTLIESQRGYRQIVESMRKGEITSTLIIGDQSPHWGAQKHWTTFFDIKTAFLVGPATIARRTNQVLVYPSYVGYKRGHYTVEWKLITDDAQSLDTGVIIDRFAALLEDDIRRIPELWLWTHRRWKHKYEDYANLRNNV
ncbi:MAG: lysophospholipid acyltransferase family protein [Bacteroidales bacterium]|nr:lysophospholipid acyltransferase family protein [Bacteroidales bacterium]